MAVTLAEGTGRWVAVLVAAEVGVLGNSCPWAKAEVGWADPNEVVIASIALIVVAALGELPPLQLCKQEPAFLEVPYQKAACRPAETALPPPASSPLLSFLQDTLLP